MNNIFLRNPPYHFGQFETFAHVEMLTFFAKWIRPECYLELGIRNGETFLNVVPHCKKAYAVDINPLPFKKTDNMEIFTMSTDLFFKSISKMNIMFDMVFIDADHSHEQSLKDFINVKDMIIDDGFIFLHDTYPYNKDFFGSTACGDVYRTAHFIKQQYNKEFEIVTLPFHPGLTIIKKININKQLIWI